MPTLGSVQFFAAVVLRAIDAKAQTRFYWSNTANEGLIRTQTAPRLCCVCRLHLFVCHQEMWRLEDKIEDTESIEATGAPRVASEMENQGKNIPVPPPPPLLVKQYCKLTGMCVSSRRPSNPVYAVGVLSTVVVRVGVSFTFPCSPHRPRCTADLRRKQ